MNGTKPPPGGRSFLGKMTEHTSKAGRPYWRLWLGHASLIGFPGEDDEAGNRTIDLFITEPRQASAGAPKQGQLGLHRQPWHT